jgi:hypothetical protein
LIVRSAATWGRSVVSNCYGDGGNVSSAAALRKRAEAMVSACARVCMRTGAGGDRGATA